MKYIFFNLVFLLIFVHCSLSLGTAGDKASFESRYIVDMPTAGILNKMNYSIYTGVLSNGGVYAELQFSPLYMINVGLSYSGINIIGNGDPEFQGIPGFHFKGRIVNETLNNPAIVAGFISQGKGIWLKSADRFEVYSPGFFVAISKNYKWSLGEVAFHSGIGYSIEPEPEDRNPNFWIGFEQSIGNYMALTAEFNAGFDEKIDVNKNKMNLGIKASLLNNFTMEIQFKNILNDNSEQGLNRFIYFEYNFPN